MNFEIIAGLSIGMVIGVASVWVAITTSTGKLNTCMELQTQILNSMNARTILIDDNTKGTHSVVKDTHIRVGRMESIQACHGREHDSHSAELHETRRLCQDMPEKFRNIIG